VYDQNAVRVTAFRVKHANLNDAFGFRVDYRGHAVVISGDMAPNENFIKYAQGADVVIHEVGVARPRRAKFFQRALRPDMISRIDSEAPNCALIARSPCPNAHLLLLAPLLFEQASR
jgi:hypothetical protein